MTTRAVHVLAVRRIGGKVYPDSRQLHLADPGEPQTLCGLPVHDEAPDADCVTVDGDCLHCLTARF